ncbi:MAG: hypothetical protein HGA95_05290, partial [Caldiserica bacterium]|nr:hypothetical protein [Caldisericota bacterium]
VFPQSQMPIRLTRLGLCASYLPQKNHVYCGSSYIIDETGLRTELPVPTAKLPEGLRWDKQKIINYENKDGRIYATLLDDTYSFDGKHWTKAEFKFNHNVSIDETGFEGKRISSVKDGVIKMIDSGHNGGVFQLAVNLSVHIEDFSLLRDSDVYSGVEVGVDEYYLTKSDNGRIRKVSGGKETLLDRSHLEAQAVPGDIATDGKLIYAMLSDYGNSIGQFARIQVYDLKLEFVREFAPSRENAVPAAIEFYNSMILLLWNDGLLESYSTEGNLLASWSYGVSGVDLASTGNNLLIMDSSSIQLTSITVVKPEMPVWPRIVTLGSIKGTAKTNIAVRSKTQPSVTVKGKNIEVEKITNQKGLWKIEISIKIDGLPAFETCYSELALDIDDTHEIVPISFIPYGRVRKVQIFEKFALDLDNGDNIELDKLDDFGMVIKNEFSNQAFILYPNLGEPIGK